MIEDKFYYFIFILFHYCIDKFQNITKRKKEEEEKFYSIIQLTNISINSTSFYDDSEIVHISNLYKYLPYEHI